MCSRYTCVQISFHCIASLEKLHVCVCNIMTSHEWRMKLWKRIWNNLCRWKHFAVVSVIRISVTCILQQESSGKKNKYTIQKQLGWTRLTLYRCHTCWCFSGSCGYLLSRKPYKDTDSRFEPRPEDLRNNSVSLLVDMWSLKHQKDIGHAHQLAPQCLWTYSWAEYCNGAHLCGLLAERRRWVIPAPVHSYSKCMTTGWLSKPLFQHLFNLSLLCPSFLSSSIERSRFASLCLLLPLF